MCDVHYSDCEMISLFYHFGRFLYVVDFLKLLCNPGDKFIITTSLLILLTFYLTLRVFNQEAAVLHSPLRDTLLGCPMRVHHHPGT